VSFPTTVSTTGIAGRHSHLMAGHPGIRTVRTPDSGILNEFLFLISLISVIFFFFSFSVFKVGFRRDGEACLVSLASKVTELEVLSKCLRPVHYNLRFKLHLEEAVRYDGSVEIEIEVLEDASLITLNALDIKILHIEVELVAEN
jgi:hypothetical protein